MSELSIIRTEIKSWEWNFKESNGRAPTVDDIKQNNAIAEKYKSYKRLSKSMKEKTPPRPSTPPRPTHRKHPQSILLSKSRVVETTAPLAAFNPFSPQKQKGKEREHLSPDIGDLRPNLFSNSTLATQNDDLSPNPFPSIQPSSFSKQPHPHFPEATNAVSRARKRLRGDPVSPSPVKEKRRRFTSQSAVLFPRPNLDSSGSDDEVDTQGADSSFVDNSPVKVPTNGKLFPQLFRENTLAPTDLFGSKGNPENMNADNDIFKATRLVARSPHHVSRKPAKGGSKVNKASAHPDTKPVAPTMNRINSKSASETSIRSTNKRPASDDEAVEIVQTPLPRSKSPLIPPSPPPSTTVPSATFNRPPKFPLKSREASKSRKKVKTDKQATSDSEEVEQHTTLKVVNLRTTHIRRSGGEQFEDDTEHDIDTALGYTRFGSPRAPSPDVTQYEGGKIEVNLPDKLQRMLALEYVAPQSRIPDQDGLVKNLLYGRRTTHYDPRRGGEIWDVGEDYYTSIDEGKSRYTEEEDWEGEPVPWDIAEL